MRKEYRKLKKKKSQTRGDETNNKKDMAATDNGDIIIVYDDDFFGFTWHDSNWVIDFSASFHITSHEGFFTSYTHGDFGHVQMENDSISMIVSM